MEHQITVKMKRRGELTQEGKSAEEIMRKLDISEMTALKNTLLDE